MLANHILDEDAKNIDRALQKKPLNRRLILF
jgi:hypothetical protein